MKLPKVYEPQRYESDIYALWEKAGAFKPQGNGSSYSIVVPPPNANASLHIGFALTMTLQDIAIRYHRLKGDRTLFIPGADHAGFETQAVFEKELAKTGKSRFDFTREELYHKIWDFVAQNRQHFEKQFRQLGGSVDWSHFTFTLDDKVVKQAYTTFKEMWDSGLIYRGERLVNYCTFHRTGFADIEVEYTPEAGKLYHIRYPLSDGSDSLTVATTRPETMLGDVAVAVHPNDARYKKLVGKTLKLPLTNREIPVITDAFVDRQYGTGAVKLTPAHDQNDFDAGKRHDLPLIRVINHEGQVAHDMPEPYRGLTVQDARIQVLKNLEAQGYLVKTETITHSVGRCYKCHTIIEPMLMEQWFVDMKPLAKQAIAALTADKIIFYPKNKKDQLIGYLNNLRDWNISRQIAWGIPIPAFQNVDDPDDWIFDERVNKETVEVKGHTYRRDPDVFDTWFSSSTWPYVTLDFPDSKDFKTFYPLNLMETGGEILYPWVSRMVMLGLYVTGDIPFKAVYIHGYVMAEDGSKMSKSIGNVINAPEVIAQYGADALRTGIIAGRVPGVNRGYDHRKVEEARNFYNKLWNIARYIEDRVGDQHHLRHQPEAYNLVDHWILTKLQHITEATSRNLDTYRFADAYEQLYHFVWDDFADWYIEASKETPNLGLLAFGLETILKLVHPFGPFVSETIWQTLAWESGNLLITSPWPSVPSGDKKQSREFEQVKIIVSEVRGLMTNLKVPSAKLSYVASPLLDKQAPLIQQLVHLESIGESDKREGGIPLTQTAQRIWLEVEPGVIRQYTKELNVKLHAQEKVIDQLKARLANKQYIRQAPSNVVEQTRQQLTEATSLQQTLSEQLTRFSMI